MNELICHLLGDYLLQSQWMAENKTSKNLAAFAHALCYSIPFLILTNFKGLFLIAISHYLIDRYRLAKYMVFFKNHLAPSKYWPQWQDCSITGYSNKLPDYVSFWLLIITDNTMHLLCNHISILVFN